jgi:hypothetical protein
MPKEEAMKILIPTMLTREQIAPQIAAIEAVTPNADIFASHLKASASVNRNACLDQIQVGDIAIMIDDDIEGFYQGWVADLVEGMKVKNAVAVSARLLNPDGRFGPTCSGNIAPTPMEIPLIPRRSHCIMPTAAIAFHHRGHRFMESMLGSGWEDNEWFAQYVDADQDAVFVQSNRCKLIHRNEAKLQRGSYWHHNQAEFFKRWPNGIPWNSTPKQE